MKKNNLLRQTAFFNLILENGLTPNIYYGLYCIHTGAPVKGKDIAEYLIASGRVIEDKLNVLHLTPVSLSLIKKVDKLFPSNKKVIDLGPVFIAQVAEYREMFPAIKFPSGSYARSNKNVLESNFKWFMETFDYEWDIIVKATQSYLEEYEEKDWMYCKSSQYFIKKTIDHGKSHISELANYCDNILSGTDNGVIPKFQQKVV